MTAAVVTPQHASRLLRSSCATLISVAAALSLGMYDLAAASFCVLVTSLNYWRNPTRGVRRNADVAVVLLAGVYHAHEAALASCEAQYAVGALVCCALYARSRRCGGSTWHMLLHFAANASNIALYQVIAAQRENQ
jgi:hypothetical protein